MRAISLATVLVAVAGYLVLWVGSKALTPGDYEVFMVYWSLFFALAGVLDGLMQETARAVTARRQAHTEAEATRHGAQAGTTQTRPEATPAPDAAMPGPGTSPTASQQAHPFRVALLVAGIVAALSLASGPFWAAKLVPGFEITSVVLLALGLASYVFQATLCGLLSATGAWGRFALLISVDSVIRLALAAAAGALGWETVAFLIVTILGAGTWAFMLLTPGTRSVLRERADLDRRGFLNRMSKAMIASGANAVLITGFSVLLSLTADSSLPEGTLAPTILAVTLTRAPILVPLQRFQPALIVSFTKNQHRILATAAKPIALVAGVSAFGMVAAYFLARPLMGLFFDPALIAPASTLGLLTLASGSTAVLMITGSAALAADRHNLYSAGWILATLIALVLLILGDSPDQRAILALGIGPLCGALVQLWVLSRSRRRGDSQTADASTAPAPAAPHTEGRLDDGNHA